MSQFMYFIQLFCFNLILCTIPILYIEYTYIYTLLINLYTGLVIKQGAWSPALMNQYQLRYCQLLVLVYRLALYPYPSIYQSRGFYIAQNCLIFTSLFSPYFKLYKMGLYPPPLPCSATFPLLTPLYRYSIQIFLVYRYIQKINLKIISFYLKKLKISSSVYCTMTKLAN